MKVRGSRPPVPWRWRRRRVFGSHRCQRRDFNLERGGGVLRVIAFHLERAGRSAGRDGAIIGDFGLDVPVPGDQAVDHDFVPACQGSPDRQVVKGDGISGVERERAVGVNGQQPSKIVNGSTTVGSSSASGSTTPLTFEPGSSAGL